MLGTSTVNTEEIITALADIEHSLSNAKVSYQIQTFFCNLFVYLIELVMKLSALAEIKIVSL